MATATSSRIPGSRAPTIQMVVLIGLCLAFFPVFRETWLAAVWYPESAHAWAMPLLLVLLLVLRRRAMSEAMARGSAWGLVLIVLAIGLYFASSFPFNYALPRRLALVPALAGAILAVGGWRVLALSIPLLVILGLAIPPGTRYFASIIIRPETVTLTAVRATLDALPGVFVELDGLDLLFTRGEREGAVALGMSNKGASLFVAYLTIGVFVVFARVRPLWIVTTAAVLALPIVLLCNYARLVIWGLVNIYGGTEPVSKVAQVVATSLSMLIAYVAFGGLVWLLAHMVKPEPEPVARVEPGSEPGRKHLES